MVIGQWIRCIGLSSVRRGCPRSVIWPPNSSHEINFLLELNVSGSQTLSSVATSVISMLLLLAGDVETNPGPGTKTKSSPSAQSQLPRSESQPAKPVGIIAFRAFQRYQGAILRSMESSPTQLAVDLCAKKIISTDTKNHALCTMGLAPVEQANILLTAVERRIASEPNSKRPFEKFCSVLKSHHHMHRVATKLMKCFLKQCEEDGSRDSSSSSESSSEEQITDHPARVCKCTGTCSLSGVQKLIFGTICVLILVLVVRALVPFLHEEKPQDAIDPFSVYVESCRLQYMEQVFPSYFNRSEFTLRANEVINLVLIKKEKKESKAEREELADMYLTGNVDWIRGMKTPLSLESIGIVNKNGVATPTRKILIEGAPGVGKTTLVWKLCRDWAHGKLLHDFSLVLMLQLRDKRIQQASTLEGLILHPDDDVRNAVVKKINKSNGKELLLIFDGYDELPPDLITEESIFLQVLEGYVLSGATTIVTSRRFATGRLPRPFINDDNLQHIEVVGFGESEIVHYITVACKSKPPSLLNSFENYLSSHPFVMSAMYNPLHCTIITDLYIWHWVEFGGGRFAPRTLTELYGYLVRALLDHNLADHPLFSNKHLKQFTFDDLPPEVMDHLLCHGELAAHGIATHKYIFEGVSCEQIGLLQEIQDLYAGIHNADRSITSYSFLHLTLQEFLAAFYWSHNLSSHELEELMTGTGGLHFWMFVEEYHIKKINEIFFPVTHRPVLLFLAGLNRLEKLPIEKMMQSYYISDYNASSDDPDDLLLYHLLFECQCTDIISSAFMDGKYLFVDLYLTSLDWFVVGYVIAHSSTKCSWDLSINLATSLEMLSMGLNYAPLDEAQFETKGKNIKTLWLPVPDKALYNLHPHTSNVLELHLTLHQSSNTSLFGQTMSTIFPNVEELYISGNLLSILDIVEVLPQLKLLTKLEIMPESYFNSGKTIFSESLDLDVINQLQNCQNLIYLQISANVYVPSDHTNSGVWSQLASRLSPSLICKLTYLTLDGFKIDSNTALSLSRSLQYHDCKLHSLHLFQCRMVSTSFSVIANGIKRNNGLRKFVSNVHTLTLNEIRALADALKENRKLERVYVEINPGDACEGVRALAIAESVHENDTTVNKERLELFVDIRYKKPDLYRYCYTECVSVEPVFLVWMMVLVYCFRSPLIHAFFDICV